MIYPEIPKDTIKLCIELFDAYKTIMKSFI